MTSDEPIIFIVDDDRHSRESVRAMVATMGLEARTFVSAEDFLEGYRGEPGCLISDLRMPGQSGIDLLRTLREGDLIIPTILISAYAEVSVAVEAMRLGAVTLLEKPYRQNEMWNAIRETLQKDAERRISIEERREIRRRIRLLTPNENSVMTLVLTGTLNKAIAAQLGISIRTVETRRQSILEKMQVHSVARLVQDVMVANDGRRPPDESSSDRA